MDGDHFAHAAGGQPAGICRGLDGGHVAFQWTSSDPIEPVGIWPSDTGNQLMP